jgi:hypothetical protein
MASHLVIVAWNRSMGRMRPILIAAALLGSVSTLTPTAHAQPTPLYLLDFSSPPHTVGLPPATGADPAPRNTVTSIVSGRMFDTPRVVSSLGALTDQPLKFDSRDWLYDQIALGLSDLPASRVYCIETDVLIEIQGASGPALGRFVILHDTPTIRNIEFIGGVISAYIPYGVTDPYPGTPIGTYELGQVIRVHSEVDLAADAWKIFLDGVLAYSGSFGHARSLYQIRVSTMLGAVAAIDNVYVTPNHCEPELDEVASTIDATPADVDPPATSAAVTPEPNLYGWNRTRVTVTLNAADNPGGGSGVREIQLALNGAEGGVRTIAGSAASVTIAAQGVTSLTYFAVDNAGNREPARTLTVRIDSSVPGLAGLPASGCTLWPPDHRLVQIATVTASDSISGLASNSPSVVGSSSEPENGLGDGATAPDIVIAAGRVSLRAERSGKGSGRVYTVTATASDLAGNIATATRTCTVPRDKR